MGNTNTHVSERRKSSRGHHMDSHHSGLVTHVGPHSSSTAVSDQINAAVAHRQRRHSSNNDEIGPVEVNAPQGQHQHHHHAGVHSKARSITGGHSHGSASMKVTPHRPRAQTTDAGNRRTRQVAKLTILI